MKLLNFRIENFRSINDSGKIEASRITSLLGRNESGKSNLLRALHSLNPPTGFAPLNKVKDFPRHQRLEDCTEDTQVVHTSWELTAHEQEQLHKILPKADTITGIRIGRRYGGAGPWVELDGLEPISFDQGSVALRTKRVAASMRAAAEKLEPNLRTALAKAADVFEAGSLDEIEKSAWAKSAVGHFRAARTALAAADAALTDKQEEILAQLEAEAESITTFEITQKDAKEWLLKQLPVFIFLEEYPDLNGHQNLAEYISRKASNALTEADKNFEKLCKVAGLNPTELESYLAQGDQESRNQLANRASSVVTQEIRRLWKDRKLRIRFNVDASYFDTFVSDPNAIFEVEVNLDERSRGFKWFLSFYITFAADTNGGAAQNAILLLDEPGLYLHARSQSDLLLHFEADFSNQILYTTHSPFMVPIHSLDSIRTVNITEEAGTTVTNDPTGDSRTLFPLQAALGYDLSQSLFVGSQNLVVEGVTDYWILSAVSDFLRETGKAALHPELTITPAGGAQKVSYMVALLTSEQMNVLVLLDDERDARNTRDELLKAKLIREENVVFVSEGSHSGPHEADIEDLLDESVFDALVRESYAKELKGKALNLNTKIPRIAKRYAKAFEDLGIEFFKTRPARLLLKKMASKPEEIVTPDSADRFAALFKVISDRRDKLTKRDPASFQ